MSNTKNVNLAGLQFHSSMAGFLTYGTAQFSHTTPGQTLGFFSGTLNYYQDTIFIAKNVPPKAPTQLVLNNVLMNANNTDPAGTYRMINGGFSQNYTIGSSGGFPIFYQMKLYTYEDNVNVNIRITISNPSAVNNVTVPNITFTGYVPLYLAQF